MNEVVLFLILLAGPGEKDLGELLGQELKSRGQDAIQVVVGASAHKRLEDEWGITVADLTTSRQIGAELTKHEPDLVLIRLNGREMAGDTIVELELWNAGAAERVTSIAGAGGNPVPGLLSSLLPLINDRWPEREGEAAAVDQTRLDIATLIKREAWTDALAALAGKDELSAREHYYRVLAYGRLGNREAALEALNEMQDAHGQHFLVGAAEGLIPVAPGDSAGMDAAAGDDGADDAAGEATGEPEEPGVPEEPAVAPGPAP